MASDSPFSFAANPNKKTLLAHSLNVLTPVKPYFLTPHSNDKNFTIEVTTNGTSNDTTHSDRVIVAGGDTLVVDSDQTILLRCENDGRPKPIVAWSKDKQMLNMTEQKYRLNGSSLKIFRTHQIDSGVYECDVSNGYGRISREYNVTVRQNTVQIKGLGKRHILLIVVISVFSLISLILLALVSHHLIKQKKENKELKVEQKLPIF